MWKNSERYETKNTRNVMGKFNKNITLRGS